jgi:uncharacterized protein YndB with AHSA1/START domain
MSEEFHEFEVRWEGLLPGDPKQVWDAFTVHAAGWIWEIAYEPRLGGAERGLTSGGGTVTAWDPPHHFQTRAERPDGWRNQLDYALEPRGDGTLLRYVHNGSTSDYEAEYDACVQHTRFYLHSMGEYVRHFAGRDAAYLAIDAPDSFEPLCRRLGLDAAAAVGDEVRLAPGLEGTIDYLTPAFLGVRTDDALVRLYGREAWGGPVTVALHLFGEDADPAQVERTWSEWLTSTEVVS